MDGVGVPRCVYSKLQRRPSFFANMFILSIVHISTFQPKFVYTKHMNICSCNIVFISCGAPVQFRLRSREASPKLIKSFDGASSSRGCGGKFVQRIRRFPCARLGHDGPGWSAERLLRVESFRIIAHLQLAFWLTLKTSAKVQLPEDFQLCKSKTSGVGAALVTNDSRLQSPPIFGWFGLGATCSSQHAIGRRCNFRILGGSDSFCPALQFPGQATITKLKLFFFHDVILCLRQLFGRVFVHVFAQFTQS